MLHLDILQREYNTSKKLAHESNGKNLTNLKELKICYCENIKNVHLIKNLVNLEKLEFYDCKLSDSDIKGFES